jgi:DNA-binding MarR family transcriptional regulator
VSSSSVDLDSRTRLLTSTLRDVARASLNCTAFGQALAPQLGISTTDLDCIAQLHEFGPASAGQLAEALKLTSGAITGVIDRLEAARFVVREADPGDRRRVIVRLTDERIVDLRQALAPLVLAAGQAVERYSESDILLFTEILRRVVDVVQQQTEQLKADRVTADSHSRLTAPLGAVVEGSLEFSNGASELRILGSESVAQLYQATFEGAQPSVRVQDGGVTFRYKRMGLLDWAKHAGTVGLAGSIPWRIALRGGVANASLDARGLDLRELVVDGGASKLDCLLSQPRGTVRVCIEGGVNRVKIERPEGVPVQIAIHGGANRVELDTQRFGAMGGDVRLASPGWELATDRYDIEVRGGASRLEIKGTQEVT